jgi:acyl-CoA thioester hydrolase
LRLELWIEMVGGARFTVRYEVYDEGRLAARAATTCVTFDFTSDRPRRITPTEREVLLAFADDGRQPVTQPVPGR